MTNTSDTEMVQGTTVDDFVKDMLIPNVDVLKIDTEGYEYKVSSIALPL